MLLVVLRDQTRMFICTFLNLCRERIVYLIFFLNDWYIKFKCVCILLRFYQNVSSLELCIHNDTQCLNIGTVAITFKRPTIGTSYAILLIIPLYMCIYSCCFYK